MAIFHDANDLSEHRFHTAVLNIDCLKRHKYDRSRLLVHHTVYDHGLVFSLKRLIGADATI